MVASVTLLVLATVLTGCQPGKVGARCRTTDFGDDGRDWVLQCRKGRWARLMTKQQAAQILLAPKGPAGAGAAPAQPAPVGRVTASPGAEPAPNDDYPTAWRNAGQDSLFDNWGFPNRQCTSFVAWRLATANQVKLPVAPGDAGVWDDRLAPFAVIDSVPAVGAIAHWNPNESFGGLGAGPLGHVGWVQAVYPDGSVTVEQYNLGSDGRYVQFHHTRAPRYIHLRDL